MGQQMSSSNNPVQDKRSNFLDKVEKEAKREEKSPNSDPVSSSNIQKPRGAGFIEGNVEPARKVVERKAPSCSRGG